MIWCTVLQLHTKFWKSVDNLFMKWTSNVVNDANHISLKVLKKRRTWFLFVFSSFPKKCDFFIPILFIWPWYFHAVHICLQRVLHRAAPDDHFNKCHMHTTKEYSVDKRCFEMISSCNLPTYRVTSLNTMLKLTVKRLILIIDCNICPFWDQKYRI